MFLLLSLLVFRGVTNSTSSDDFTRCRNRKVGKGGEYVHTTTYNYVVYCDTRDGDAIYLPSRKRRRTNVGRRREEGAQLISPWEVRLSPPLLAHVSFRFCFLDPPVKILRSAEVQSRVKGQPGGGFTTTTAAPPQ